MYHIDWWELKSQVSIAHLMIGHINKDRAVEEDQTTQYSLVSLDIVVNCLNDKINRFNDDSFQLYVKDKYGEDPKVWALGEMVMSMVTDIKREFYAKFGHDPRLKYRLVSFKEHGVPTHRIIMDLEQTFLDFVPKQDIEDITQDVDDNPTQEKMNELFSHGRH